MASFKTAAYNQLEILFQMGRIQLKLLLEMLLVQLNWLHNWRLLSLRLLLGNLLQKMVMMILLVFKTNSWKQASLKVLFSKLLLQLKEWLLWKLHRIVFATEGIAFQRLISGGNIICWRYRQLHIISGEKAVILWIATLEINFHEKIGSAKGTLSCMLHLIKMNLSLGSEKILH